MHGGTVTTAHRATKRRKELPPPATGGWILLVKLNERNRPQKTTCCMIPFIESSKSRQNYSLLLKVIMAVTMGVVTARGLRGILGCCSWSGFDPSAGSPPPLPPALFCVCVCMKICNSAHLWFVYFSTCAIHFNTTYRNTQKPCVATHCTGKTPNSFLWFTRACWPLWHAMPSSPTSLLPVSLLVFPTPAKLVSSSGILTCWSLPGRCFPCSCRDCFLHPLHITLKKSPLQRDPPDDPT